jgi:hypothetical protein
MRRALAKATSALDAIDARQPDVHQHDVRRRFLVDPFQSPLARGHCRNFEVFALLEYALDSGAQELVVLDDPDAGGCAHP